ncbi:hypothetical protein BBI15_11475 [Planococcus plakortidis]|uniref:Uncharacterized protein n=1 Tax=Planococcus plakortidis TaxID=1038856 RepID=A0A1C7EAL9_9BACL|nr:hypothetical protein [Planococcus plakortidis]ANU20789.1 hypothetical protein BBI15_11475 [Planococcus plakortidis]
MEPEKKRVNSNSKQPLQRYLLPITIISSILISGAVGYTASNVAINNSSNDSAEMNAMKNQVNKTKQDSIQIIETEMPKIIGDLEKYNEDINLISENIKWLKDSIAPIRESTGIINSTFTVVEGVNTFTRIPYIENYIDDLKFAKIKLDEVDNTLSRLENLTIIQEEINDSHQKLELLFEGYQKDKSLDQLLLIEEELNSNLIYQIEDFRNLTTEAREVFELSSSVLSTLNKAQSILVSVQETGRNTLEVVQFWKDNDVDTEIEENIKQDLEKDLKVSEEKIQQLPEELAEQSKKSITSINKVKEELQTVKIAQMVIGE